MGSLPETPLRREADGVFEGTVVGAREGDTYRYAFTRGDAGLTRIDPRARRLSADDVVVIANLRNRRYARDDVGLPAGGAWRVLLDSDDPRWSTDFQGPVVTSVQAAARAYDGQPFAGSIALGPWSVVVLGR